MKKSNADQYHFSDFTRDNYRRLLRLAKAKYAFANYQNYISMEHFVLWRHDLDFSVHAGRRLAEIEAEEGVQATYFLLLHSEFYNLLEKDVVIQIKRIIECGHDVALHFDAAFYGITEEKQLEKNLLRERKILEDFFGQKIQAFSYHVPTDFTLSCREERYGGMLNVYADTFQKNIAYCSDSNGYWRHRRLEDVLQKADDPKLQVLTHPEYWQEKIMSPKEKIARCIEGRALKTKNTIEEILRVHNRENIDW